MTVLNSTGGTFTLRLKDVGGGVLANMSVPTDLSGNTMVSSASTFTSTAQSGAVVLISSLSANHTVSLSSAAQVTLTSNTVTLSSNPTVIVSSASNQTVTSLTSGTVVISNGANQANVVAGSSTVTSTMSALVVALSTLGNFSVTTSSQVQITNGTNTANVLAGSSTITSTMAALAIQVSPNGAPTLKAGGTGAASSADTAWVVSLRDVNPNGGTTSSQSSPTVNADQYGGYVAIAAGQTQTALTQSASAGRAGDYLSYVMVFPNSSNSGGVTIFDSTGTTVATYAGAASVTLASLIPFPIQIGAYSVSSGWKITTGSSVSVVAVGKFT